MTASISDNILDIALNAIRANTTAVLACSSEPTDRASALASALASRTTLLREIFGAPEAAEGGRKIIAVGLVIELISVAGTITHWAFVSDDDLLVHGPLTDPHPVDPVAAPDLGICFESISIMMPNH
jgi:hypothetical protein